MFHGKNFDKTHYVLAGVGGLGVYILSDCNSFYIIDKQYYEIIDTQKHWCARV